MFDLHLTPHFPNTWEERGGAEGDHPRSGAREAVSLGSQDSWRQDGDTACTPGSGPALLAWFCRPGAATLPCSQAAFPCPLPPRRAMLSSTAS